ncbi:MAG: lytic murein transglycosylase [Pseudomonadota bacterium]|nr:lytic murein transglycosylase [Pseudomonadota bacterium]
MKRLFFLLAGLATVSLVFSDKSAANPKGDFQTWLAGVRAEALEGGISPNVVKQLLTDVQPNRRVIKRDRSQAEFKLTLSIYRKRVVTPTNISVGRKKAAKHRNLLRAVSKKYGVQPRFIMAIWGIETRYGAVEANVPLVSSLATLAYDARRSKFFRKQLFDTLQMVNKGYIGADSLFGSWAGAMGQPQFMPSSYLAYAQDFDGDGRRDIWKNEGDVFASIANYLASHGWNENLTWGRMVLAPATLVRSLAKPSRRSAPGCRARTSERKTLSDWQKLGLRRADGTDLPVANLSAALVLPDGPKGEAYIVYSNYAAIMAYNCAHLYAITVGTLADSIGTVK